LINLEFSKSYERINQIKTTKPWPVFDAPDFILEALDVDESFADRVVPAVSLDDECQKLFLQIGNALLEALGVNQSLLKVSGGWQTGLDEVAAVCNVIPEKNE
jgi:hypothetical protein